MERKKKYHKKSEYEIWNLSKLAKKKLLFCFVLQLHFEPLRGFRPICELLLVWFCSLGLDGADRTSMDAESRLPRLSRLPANKYDICVCVFFFDLIFEYFFQKFGENFENVQNIRLGILTDWILIFWIGFWIFGVSVWFQGEVLVVLVYMYCCICMIIYCTELIFSRISKASWLKLNFEHSQK